MIFFMSMQMIQEMYHLVSLKIDIKKGDAKLHPLFYLEV
jgi:hypothetical protein